MLKVAVITGARAEYWLLRPLMQELRKTDSLMLLVTGEHLNGVGQELIEKDEFNIDKTVECLSQDDSYLAMTQAMARGLHHFGGAFTELKPDITVMLGDRYETLAAAMAAYTLKIPIAHIHGGEVTHGALDEGFRHTISKMASLHFVSHEAYRKRLLRMGESPDRIHTVGAVGLDNLALNLAGDKAVFFKKYPDLEQKKYFLVTMHSSTLSENDQEADAEILIQALDDFPEYAVVVTQSNRDPCGLVLNRKWQAWANRRSNVYFMPILGDDYLQMAYYSKMVIGNSSSGVLEIPYLDRPVINLGIRQQGRIMPKGVYTIPFNVQEIKSTLTEILKSYHSSEKIYGVPGEIAKNIHAILLKSPIKNLIYKRFHDEV